MTHTLNRTGLSEDRPGEEIVFLCMVHCKQKPQKANEMKTVAQMVLRHGPDNIIGAPLGFDQATIESFAPQAGIITAVFSDKNKAVDLCREIKGQDMGLSVVISALYKDVRDICQQLKLKEHTYHVSLGIFGRTELLPEKEVLTVTTQCGHHMVSPNLVRRLVDKVRRGKIASQDAAELLTRPCVCGIVNPNRVKGILEKMASHAQ